MDINSNIDVNDGKPMVWSKINKELDDLNSTKYQLTIKMSLSISKADDSAEYTKPYIRGNQEAITESESISASLDASIQRMQETLERWTNRGSGWGVNKIVTLYLDTANYMPFKGRSYVDLPLYYKKKKAIINVKNKGDDCFRMMIISAQFPADKHSDRPSSYPKDIDLNLDGKDKPTPILQIDKAEKENNLAINVF